MEVRYHHQPKRLYKHAVPVMALSLTVLALASVVFIKYSGEIGVNDRALIGKGLFSPVLHVEARTNGLSHISMASAANVSTEDTAVIGDTLGGAGEVARTSMTIQAAAANIKPAQTPPAPAKVVPPVPRSTTR